MKCIELNESNEKHGTKLYNQVHRMECSLDAILRGFCELMLLNMQIQSWLQKSKGVPKLYISASVLRSGQE